MGDEKQDEGLIALGEATAKAISGLSDDTANFLEVLNDRIAGLQFICATLVGELAAKSPDPESALSAFPKRALDTLTRATFHGMSSDRVEAFRARIRTVLIGMLDMHVERDG